MRGVEAIDGVMRGVAEAFGCVVLGCAATCGFGWAVAAAVACGLGCVAACGAAARGAACDCVAAGCACCVGVVACVVIFFNPGLGVVGSGFISWHNFISVSSTINCLLLVMR